VCTPFYTKFSISAQYHQYEAPHNTIYTVCGGGGGGDNSVTKLCGGGSVESVDTVCGGGDGKSVNTVCGGGRVRVWIQCAAVAAAAVKVCAQRGGGGGAKSVNAVCGGGSVKSVNTVCGDGGGGKSVNTVQSVNTIQCAAVAVVLRVWHSVRRRTKFSN
jgi:hypothetical protein